MPPVSDHQSSFPGRWGLTGHTDWGRAENDDLKQVVRGLDQIPRLMYQLSCSSDNLGSGYHDQFVNEKERRRKRSFRAERQYCGAGDPKPTTPPTRHDSYEGCGASPPAPPPRALELVKEEVHRALQAFSTRPLKGEPKAPRASDLLRPFDIAKDGKVTYPEFKAGLRGLGLGLMADEAEGLARYVDGEGTGLVNREKFEVAAIEDWGRETTVGVSPPAAAQSQNGSGSRCEREPPGVTQRGQGRQEKRYGAADGAVRCEEDFDGRYGISRSVASTKDIRSAPRRDGRDCASCGENHGRGTKVVSASHRAEENARLDDNRLLLPPSAAQKIHASRSNVGGKLRNPTVSFDRWKQMTTGRSSDAGATLPVATSSGDQSVRLQVDHSRCNKTAHSRGRASRKHPRPLDTLRSLLQGDGFDDETMHIPRPYPDGKHNVQCQPHQQHGEDEHVSFRTANGSTDSGVSSGSGRKCGAGRGRESPRAGRRKARPYGTPADGAARRGRQGEASSSELERVRVGATRAENILTLRSRGDLVGLRRALSRADPSASGVLSRREVERVILRRFGAGLGDDEAKELAARYRQDFSGCTMVDYGRLVDNLEAKEAGLQERTVGLERLRQQNTTKPSRSAPRTSTPVAAGARCRNTHNKRSTRLHRATRGGHASDPPEEETQLVRRARAKTIALLDRHGTQSVDCVFGLIDPAHTERFTARQLREGLHILGGTDPMSDVEHRALFREISRGEGRVKYREILDTLRASEAKENRERIQRKLAHQAELPASGRGSGVHFRHSDVLDVSAPGGNEAPIYAGLSGGRQHKEARRHALVQQRLRDSVRMIQEDRNSAGPVFEMFRREGTDRDAAVPAGVDNCDAHTPPPLSPSELRSGLSTLGVSFGDHDFTTLLAAADPERHGRVSYPDFCKALRLHQLRGDFTERCAATQRPSSARLLLSSQSNGQGAKIGGAATGGRGRATGSEGGGSARRRAMELAPPADANLDGGVFYRNAATDGCSNPNFTTTMISSWDSNTFRPKKRQSPAPALGSVFSGIGPNSRRQTIQVVGGGERWNENGEEAEMHFRHGLGVKSRRRCSYSSTAWCPSARGSSEGWDNVGTVSPRGGSGGFGNSEGEAAAGHGSKNRRGRTYTPRNSDLGFGSERIRSESQHDDGRSGCTGGAHRSRSLSLGAERRYGDWARSSVQHLLRHDGWLGFRSALTTRSPSGGTTRGYYSDRGGGIEMARGAATKGRYASSSSGSAGGYRHSRSATSRHPAQVTQRRDTPYGTDADAFMTGQGGRRSGGGGGDGIKRGRRMATATDDREVRPVGRARDPVCVPAVVDTSNRRRQGGVIGGSGSGGPRRTSHVPDQPRGWSAGVVVGGTSSPSLHWGATGLLGGNENGRGQETSSKSKTGALAVANKRNVW